MLLTKEIIFSIKLTGCLKKMHRSFYLIFLATNMLEGWNIFHLKDGIHNFVWSKILLDIKEPRYKQIKIGYQISKFLNILAPLWFTEMSLNLKHN